MAQHIHDQLNNGAWQLDLESLERFAGVVAAVANESQLRSAKLVDEAASNLARNLSVLGLVTGPVSAALSSAASLTSLASGSDDTALGVAEQQFDQLLDRGFALRVLGLSAIFGSGRVRTPAGHKVELEIGDNDGRLSYRLHGRTGEPARPKRGAGSDLLLR